MSATSDAWPIWTPASDATPLDAILSHAALHGIYRVADAAERDTDLPAALTAAGVDTSIIYVHRLDAEAGAETEYTIDAGANWTAIDCRDSGWIDLFGTESASWGTGEIRLRRVGKTVEFRVDLEVGTSVSGAGLVTLATDYRPPWGVDDAAISNSSGGTPVQVVIDTGGVIRFYWAGSLGSTNVIRWHGMWTV